MKQYFLDVDGQRVAVWAQKLGNELWFHWNGKTEVLELKSKSNHRTKDGGTGGGEGVIEAPMPGKIIKSNFSVGDKVDAGETLIVMEAMKMEYSLEADKAGVIKSWNAQVDQQVALGEVLAEIGDDQ